MKNFVILGASGDLAREKLFPALWEIFQRGYKCDYVGYGRSLIPDDQFRQIVRGSVPSATDDFISRFSYISGEYNASGLRKLKDALHEGVNTFYLSIPTRIEIVRELVSGFNKVGLFDGEYQLIVEKPFGADYSSATELMSVLKENAREENLFLIDHYLAKDLVRNLITLRFANPIFENVWSNKFIQKIEIQALEDSGINNRGEYYDNTGAIRDMIQNHVLQVLSLVLMNRPSSFDTSSMIKEKRRILEDLQMFEGDFGSNIRIGQYKGFLDEKFIDKESVTETFASLKVEVANERWKGVPILLTTGKKQKEKRTQVSVYFKGIQDCLWDKDCLAITQNKLEINIHPENDVRLYINSKIRSSDQGLKQIPLRFGFADEADLSLPYANALVDIYNKDRSYTPSIEEILLSWKFIDKVEEWLGDKRKELLTLYSGKTY